MSTEDDKKLEIEAPPPPPEEASPPRPPAIEEPKTENGKDEKRDDRDRRDRDRDRSEKKSSRRSRSRSRGDRERRSSRRSRSRERRERRRSRSRDRSRDRRRSRSRSRDRRRSDRDRSRERSRERSGGYHPRQRENEGTAATNTFSMRERPGGGQLDYFSAVRGPSVDAWTQLRKVTETRLEAKVQGLKTKLVSARDPKNRTQRKVYIGNVLPTLTSDFLRQLFQQTLLISYPQWNQPGLDIITDIQHKEGAKYAFIEFRSMEMAHAACQINGTKILGTELLVTRPTGYIDIIEAEKALEAAETELRHFRSGQDESPMYEAARQMGLMPPLAGAPSPFTAGGQHGAQPTTAVVSSSQFISIDGVLTADVIDNEQEVTEILEELKEKCGESGPVKKAIVPRPPFGIKASELFGKGNFGKVFVEFADAESAQKCKDMISSTLFDGRPLVVQFVSEALFNTILGI